MVSALPREAKRTLAALNGHLARLEFEPQFHHRPTPSLPRIAWLERPVLPDTPPRAPDVDVDAAITMIAAQFTEWRSLCQALAKELKMEHRELARLIFERLEPSA
jgi:hypothetical protein